MEPRIILHWDDRNLIESGHRIYRSNTQINTSYLPLPIAVLGDNVTEYTDNDVINGNFYYYRVSAFTPTGEEISEEIYAEATIDLGPGPTTLIAGDMTAGFFGEVGVSELISGNNLANAIGLSAGSAQHTNEPWLKFALDGNIVYVAKKPYRHTISWQSIYQAGQSMDRVTTV